MTADLEKKLNSPVKSSKIRSLGFWVLSSTILFGLFIRVQGMGASLTLDEFGTLWATEGNLVTTWDRAVSFHAQTPFYYLLAWIPLHLLGESETALRFCSLFFGLALLPVVYFGVGHLYSKSVGLYSLFLVGIHPTFVVLSTAARPYSLALFCLAVSVLGFSLAVKNGSRVGRVCWVLGGALTAWAHYLFFPAAMALSLAYFVIPGLRRLYTAPAFRKDLLAQLFLVALVSPHLLPLLLRRESLDWIQAPMHLGPLALLVPWVIALVYGEISRRGDDKALDSLHLGLWIAVIFEILLLECLFFLGVNLLHPRYMTGLLVPALFLTSSALTRVKPVGALLALLWAGVFSGMGLRGLNPSSDPSNGGWRGAVSALEEKIGPKGSPPVLFRSGFVEEDRLPLGSPDPATLSPLRSPGRGTPGWEIISLTYRWETLERREYFRQVIQPRLDGREEFFFLGSTGGTVYSSALIQWVEETWPGRFRHVEEGFGVVSLIRFQRNTPS